MSPDTHTARRAPLTRLLALGALVAVATAGACARGTDTESPGEYAGVATFDTARVRIASATDTTTLTVELAETGEQQSMGLMERTSLAPDAGMLFLYRAEQPASSAFWMFRTRIPLDIAFVDADGVIRAINAMAPCPSTIARGCPDYPAGVPHLAALEVNGGWFARAGYRVGDRVLLGDTSSRRRSAR